MQILTRQVSRGAQGAAFLTSSQVMPTQLAPGPHTERPAEVAQVFLPASPRAPGGRWVFRLSRSSFSARLVLPGPLSVRSPFLSTCDVHAAPFASWESR